MELSNFAKASRTHILSKRQYSAPLASPSAALVSRPLISSYSTSSNSGSLQQYPSSSVYSSPSSTITFSFGGQPSVYSSGSATSYGSAQSSGGSTSYGSPGAVTYVGTSSVPASSALTFYGANLGGSSSGKFFVSVRENLKKTLEVLPQKLWFAWLIGSTFWL